MNYIKTKNILMFSFIILCSQISIYTSKENYQVKNSIKMVAYDYDLSSLGGCISENDESITNIKESIIYFYSNQQIGQTDNQDNELLTPNINNCTFQGWYYDSSLTNKVNGNLVKDVINDKQVYTDDNNCVIGVNYITRLYASCDLVRNKICTEINGGSFILHYNTNGGNSIESITVPIAAGPDSYTDIPIPTRHGYVFDGWYYDENFTNKVNGTKTNQIEYTGGYDENGCQIRYSNVTLYAKWMKENMNPDTGDNILIYFISAFLIIVIGTIFGKKLIYTYKK